ncbi:hypothetical protein ACE6H2_016448 [Prunus campanulata]
MIEKTQQRYAQNQLNCCKALEREEEKARHRYTNACFCCGLSEYLRRGMVRTANYGGFVVI